MTTLAPPPAVTDFANAVRDHLAGLDAETLDELTGGLEADLAEALAERAPDGGATDLAAVTALFGSPGRYAEELRVAAGVELPAAEDARRPTLRSIARRRASDVNADWRRWRAEHAWANAVIEFLVALRPVWWVGRGWVVFMWLTGTNYTEPLGRGLLSHLLLIGTVVLSVLWGQRRLGQQRWLRRLGTVVSAVAAISLLVMLNLVGHQLHGATWSQSSYDAGWNDGFATASAENAASDEPGTPIDPLIGVTDLFVYDAAGDPVESAQIVDQEGHPLVLADAGTGTPWSDWTETEWFGDAVPAAVFSGGQLNVYPLLQVPGEAITQHPDGSLTADLEQVEAPRWPAASLFPVPDPATDEAADSSATGDEPEPSEEPSS